MVSFGSEETTIYACGIEQRVTKKFKQRVRNLCNNVGITITRYTCDKRKSWNLAELTVDSKDDAVMLMCHLKNVKCGNSRFGLRMFWPAEMGQKKRKKLNARVRKFMTALNRNEYGCFYHKDIEEKKVMINKMIDNSQFLKVSAEVIISNVPESMHQMELFHLASQAGIVTSLKMIESDKARVVYPRQSDAVIALLCLDKFEILSNQPIHLKILHSAQFESLYDEVFRLRNILKKERRNSDFISLQQDDMLSHEETDLSSDQLKFANQRGNDLLESEMAENRSSHKFDRMAENIKETNIFNGMKYGDIVDDEDMIKKENILPQEVCFLIQQVNLEQKLRDKGYKVSFKFTNCDRGSKLTVYMIRGTQYFIHYTLSNFSNVVDGRGSLSDQLCDYFAQYTEMREFMNQKLRDDDIYAGVFKKSGSTYASIVALDVETHQRANEILQEIFCTRSVTFASENLLLLDDKDEYLSKIRDGLAFRDKVHFKVKADICRENSAITVTGPRKITHDALPILSMLVKDYGLVNLSFKVTPPSILEYLQIYRKENIQKLENEYKCHIEMAKALVNTVSRSKITKNITIQCAECYKTVIRQKLNSMIGGFVTEREDWISQYSKIGRFITSSQNIIELDGLRTEMPCVLIITRNGSYSVYSVNEGKLKFNYQQKEKSENVPNKPIQLETESVNLPEATKSPTMPAIQNNDYELKVNNVTIRILKGELEKIGKSVDAIVNSVDHDNFDHGKIASSLSNIGGNSYLKECRNQLGDLGIDSIGCTSGHYFGCKSVYHILFLSSDRSLLWLSNRLRDCLMEINNDSLESIAIPAIGTGQAGLNANKVAQEMMRVSIEFAVHNTGSLRKINFVIYPTDVEIHKAFKNALKSSVPLATELLYQNEQIEEIIKPIGIKKTDFEDKNRLLFSAQCLTDEKPICINVYHGNLNGLKADAIMDMTALCSKHSKVDSLSDTLRITDTEHTSETLQILPISGSDCKTYQVCLYGCLAGFSSILTHMNANGEKSVNIPLLNIEMNSGHIKNLIDFIETFIAEHQSLDMSINCINFVIGYDDRAEEIASWMQRKLKSKAVQFNWQTSCDSSIRALGINIFYIAQSKEAITRVKSKIEESSHTWTCRKLTSKEFFSHIDENRWQQLVLQYWSEYNTILVNENQGKVVSIYGFEKDIADTISAIHEQSKIYFQEKALEEVKVFTADSARWSVKVGRFRRLFEPKLSYEIEKNYKNYVKDNSKIIFRIDSETKTINLDSMKVTHINGMEYPIKKLSIKESKLRHDIPIPRNWEYQNKHEIKDGYFQIVNVTNQQEIDEISKLLGLRGFTVRNLRRIQNWNLYRKYQTRKAEVTAAVKRYKPGADVEKRLFHGTAASKVDVICKNGFDRDYSGTSCGSKHGTGSYFGVKAEYSKRFGNALLLVRVLTGIYVKSSVTDKPDLSMIPGSKGERAHSVVDHESSPSLYVISNDNSAYPEYIIYVQSNTYL
ncbi:Poly [ADP-ribose] polymerase 14 [Trichoplax sp. H2]|nr:Poly [ADP-ribose] polymerase 14 [Trichoplax sp. H2]|eukprot:RDD38022.1 Poly [ADP-ribose] polymerase 14 [Trichoplax sp. H2]